MADQEQDYPGYAVSPDSHGLSEEGQGRRGASTAAGGSWKVLLIVFLMVLAALAWLASSALRWQKEVSVRSFVVDGLSLVSRVEITSRLNAYQGVNLQKLNVEELKMRLMAIPYVDDALISKELNGIVRIRVIERVPFAVTVINGTVMIIDREGVLLPYRKEFSSKIPKLLKISGASRITMAKNGLQQLDRGDVKLLRLFMDAFRESEYARLLISELHLADNNMTYCIAVQTPSRFIVGNDGNFKEKLKKFEIFWQKVVSKKGFGSYETVDLRFRDRIFTTDPVSLEVPQGRTL